MGKHKVYCKSGLGVILMDVIDGTGRLRGFNPLLDISAPGECEARAYTSSRFGGYKATNALFGLGESGIFARRGNVQGE